MAKRLLFGLLLSSCFEEACAATMNPAKVTDTKQYCFYASYKVLTAYTFGNSSGSPSNSTRGAANSTNTASPSSFNATNSSSNSTDHGNSGNFANRKLAGRAAAKATATTMCTTSSETLSLYAALMHYCPSQTLFDAGLRYWLLQCKYLNLTLNVTMLAKTITPAYVARLPLLDPMKNTTKQAGTITWPVLLDESYYVRSYRSNYASGTAKARDMAYGWGIVGFWGGILGLGIIFNIFSTITAWYNARTTSRVPTYLHPIAALIDIVRTHVVIPAAVGTHHRRLLCWSTIPKRLDALVVGAFWLLAVILTCVDFQSFAGNINTPNVKQQNWTYLADRTGSLCFACLPVIWLFGTRNNPFIWASSISFHSFNMFHRHVARFCVLAAIVHATCYTVRYGHYEHSYYKYPSQNFFYMGIVAIVLMSLMLAFSNTWFRRKFYELFLLIHIVFAAVTVYALYRHVHVKNRQFKPYLWPVVAVWSFDRLMRIIRIAYCNIRVTRSSSVNSSASSTVSYNNEANVLRIDIESNNFIIPGPGQHYHLYQPFALRGWENHPFTLGAYSTRKSIKTPTSPSTPLSTSSQTVEGTMTDKKVGVSITQQKEFDLSPISTLAGRDNNNENSLTFFVRPYDGWTKRLRDQCLKSPGGIYNPTLLLEGPYGHATSMHQYDTLLMIVGGTGISAALPHIIEHVRATTPSRLTQIRLIWAVKQRAFIDQLCRGELAAAWRRDDIEWELYCTDSRMGSSGAPSEEISLAGREKINGIARPTVRSGRPNVKSIINEAALEAQTAGSRIAVLTCGPAHMADQCRDAVHRVMKAGFRDVYYHEEAFGW